MLSNMFGRLTLIARGLLLGMAWGTGAAIVYGASWQRGMIAGLQFWGPAIFVGVSGPYAPELTTA